MVSGRFETASPTPGSTGPGIPNDLPNARSPEIGQGDPHRSFPDKDFLQLVYRTFSLLASTERIEQSIFQARSPAHDHPFLTCTLILQSTKILDFE